MKISKRILSTALVLAFFLFMFVEIDTTDARTRGGGRSFGQSRSYSKPSPSQSFSNQTARPSTPFNSSNSFLRGMAGGVLGGVLGGMLFGGMAHGMGMGGIGGSGIGLFEILLLAGLGFLLYRFFISRKQAFSPNSNFSSPYGQNTARIEDAYEPETEENILVNGVRQIWEVDQNFDPDRFKETAQDLFFKIQAAWTRREVSVLQPFVGDQLLEEYKRHFAEMKQKGHINKLENISVRNVELVNAGVEGSEIFVTVNFTANLLDYIVDENTGNVVSGSSENPVKFEENWTFARKVGYPQWKLEGIDS
ncbi:MAG: Tim44 domain-containing protein [Desulfobacterales bacterium]|nr:Tim44 domain-containing protein [Desulfobacterales bacterium]MBF0395212.1 Tim44 domain-containing protein [Desulfobacterales bacterium]